MDKIEKIIEALNKAIIGKKDIVDIVLAGALSRGHLLLEDVPGTGKTTLCKVLAKVIGCSFKRIQFTPDLMPSDIIGLSIYDKNKEDFTFMPGPIMSQFVLADEINRASPKTQAALLEAMAEKQVTVDGKTINLPDPFIVVATQNPIEYEGTYPLPEAQLDRFTLKVALGYPDEVDESQIIELNERNNPLGLTKTIINANEFSRLQEEIDSVFFADSLKDYIIKLTNATRHHSELMLGVSSRAAQHLYRVAKSMAYISGRNYVLPDDIKTMVKAVFSHRVVLKPEARLKGKSESIVIDDIINQVYVPVVPVDRS